MKKNDFDKLKAALKQHGFNESFDVTLESAIRQQRPLQEARAKQRKKPKKGKGRQQ